SLLLPIVPCNLVRLAQDLKCERSQDACCAKCHRRDASHEFIRWTAPLRGSKWHDDRPRSSAMTVELFVNGTLMRGLALHHNLDGATFLGAFRTAPRYRLYSIGDVHPGMFEVESGGVPVAGELYRLPDEVWAR